MSPTMTAAAPALDAREAAAPYPAVAERKAPARPAIIDCDLHNEIDSLKDL